MSENTLPTIWPPNRKRTRDALSAIDNHVFSRTAAVSPIPTTPRNTHPHIHSPTVSASSRKLWRNGFETTPKAVSFTPYVTPKRQPQNHRNPFNTDHIMVIKPATPLSIAEWNVLAKNALLLPSNTELCTFQMQASNLVLARKDDLILITPTGFRKSVIFSLPLHAQRNGISIVVTLYTSLGMEGADKYVIKLSIISIILIIAPVTMDRGYPQCFTFGKQAM